MGPEKKTFKAAVIGMGPHGRRIVDAIVQLENCQLAAVVDRSEQALAYEKLPASTARLTSTDPLWKSGVDVVCVATNGPSHAALSIAAMEAGVRHLLVAKPMACSLAECDSMLVKARETGTRLVVDHIRRHAPAYIWLRQRIASGDWGETRAVWMQRPGIGLGCNATHSFDAIRFITGRDVTQVTGWVDPPVAKNPRGAEYVDPGGLVVMQLGANLRAVVAQIEDGAGPTTVEIDFTAARVRLDEKSGQIEVIERDTSVKPGPGRPPVYRNAELPADLNAKIDMHAGLRDLIANLLSGDPLACDATHGRASVEVLVATYISDRRGHAPLAIPSKDEELNRLWLPIT